jgi:hypothetical protein
MNKTNKMNKKGDLPVTILLIGVFFVCTLALLSFFYSSYVIHKSFVGIGMVEKANAQIEANNLDHFYVYRNKRVISPEWGFDWMKEKIIFSMEYNP